ncbi:uncharacterized protein LOC129750178 [Uranotaenia lowii]|uniref:uncharacterized protein LOC129750178 n=1 Tax=Uranotaenia lowii TaxID=190385 RepID=UPI00247A0D62|nr:uncharacterized protein LOC129750178 [Uranotaenia lowii]
MKKIAINCNTSSLTRDFQKRVPIEQRGQSYKKWIHDGLKGVSHDVHFTHRAAILQQTAEYIYALEQEKTRLLSQNCQLKRLLDQQEHSGDLQQASSTQTTQIIPGSTVLATTITNSQQVATVAKKRKIDTIMSVPAVSDSSDEGLGSMSPEPVSLMQVVNSANGQTIVTTTSSVNGRPGPATINVSAKDFLDLKHQLDIERRQKAVYEERLKALERQIYPARVIYPDQPDSAMVDSSEPLEEITVSAIQKPATKVIREVESVQLIALDTAGKKPQLVVCTPTTEVIEETIIQPSAIVSKSAIIPIPIKEEKPFVKRSRSRSPTIETTTTTTVVTLPPKKNRYPTILEAAIKAEPKVEVERIDSPSSIVVSDDHLTRLTSNNLVVTSQRQQHTDASRINTCRHNLETIVEAIRHLEGDAFDSVTPVHQQQQLAIVRPAVQEVPLALTTSSKQQQQQKERDHRQSQLEPFLKFRTTGSSSASSSTSNPSSSSNPTSGVVSASGSSSSSSSSTLVSLSITPASAIAGSGSPSHHASTITLNTPQQQQHHTTNSSSSSSNIVTSQILQQQQCRPGVIVVKQNS